MAATPQQVTWIDASNTAALGGWAKLYGKSMVHLLKGTWRWKGDTPPSTRNRLPENSKTDSVLQWFYMQPTYTFDQDNHEWLSDILSHTMVQEIRPDWVNVRAARDARSLYRTVNGVRVYDTNSYGMRGVNQNYEKAYTGPAWENPDPYLRELDRPDSYNTLTNTTRLRGGYSAVYDGALETGGQKFVAYSRSLFDSPGAPVSFAGNRGGGQPTTVPRTTGAWTTMPGYGVTPGSAGENFWKDGIKGIALTALPDTYNVNESLTQLSTRMPLIGYIQFATPYKDGDNPFEVEVTNDLTGEVTVQTDYRPLRINWSSDVLNGLVQLSVAD